MANSFRQFSILIVDDEKEIISSLVRLFARNDFQVLSAVDGSRGLEILAAEHVDLLILDLKMPGMDGISVLKKALEIKPGLKVIIQTGYGGVGEAVEAIKLGASDFLQKGDSPEILRLRVGKVHQLWLLEQENSDLRSGSGPQFSYSGLLGESAKVQRLKDMIVRVGPTDTTVLIQGESGTGKELVARAIHHHSLRKDQPFVAVDCAAINETVIESELFGHTKGAFTGADSATQGLIRAAEQGTLFLDEIGELSLPMQAKFLRTLQERVVRPVGSTRSYPVDIRIVAATNRNLLDEVAAGAFRQDLYYRISSVTLVSPPLREREQDILLLAQRILAEAAAGSAPELTSAAKTALLSYEWPGNVRELENVLRGALVFAEGGTICAEDLPQPIAECSTEELPVSGSGQSTGTLAAYELLAIKNALQQAGNNRRVAAQILDIAEATLYRKIKQYHL